MSSRVATDVGGTFTDLASFDAATNVLTISKASTTLDVKDGVADAVKKAKIDLATIGYFVHGSTIAINTVIERNGARTGLLSTEGFRDTLEIARGNIINAFDLMFTTPEPLVPRRRRLEIAERMLADGHVLKPVDVEQALKALRALEAADVDAIAVCLLHSYANPENERTIKDLIAKHASRPVFISISSDIVREYREFERTSTSVLNAYVGPRVSGYLDGLQQFLDAGGFAGTAMIMQSGGGTMSIDLARQQPVRMMESGPVGGTVAAAHVAAKAGFRNVVAFDMGGTTAKVSLVRNGQLDIAEGYFIGGEEHGYPLQLPVVDVVEIGAGGGSIAHIDLLGALKIGPESAGAIPGPAAYGKGGTRPTVTDANVVLGRLNPAYFLGGDIGLSVERAEDAIARDIAEPLHLEMSRAAFGIVKIADTYMAQAVRQMTVQKGYDPREFVLFAYGGGGPGHAVSIARELGIKTVVIPPHPGIFSALGMLLSDAKESFKLSRICKMAESNAQTFEPFFQQMEQEGRERMRLAEFGEADIRCVRAVEMRYVGQEFTLRLPYADPSVSDVVADLQARFAALHELRYGHAFEKTPTELVAIHVEVYGHLPKPVVRVESAVYSGERQSSRRVFFEDLGYVETAIHRREELRPGVAVAGPAIIEEVASTSLIHPGDSVVVDGESNMIVTVATLGERSREAALRAIAAAA
jgi:N-methylhydantoinase A